MKTKTLLTLLLFLISNTIIFAQSDCACCTEKHIEFDFWVGEWIVSDTAGNKVGENTISKMESNCILREQWKGAGGGTGSSINYFNKADSSWNQTWVDNKGSVLELKGKLENGVMVLKSELIQGQTKKYFNQISWTPKEDGSVVQLWEIYGDDKTLLKTLFKGIYRPK